MTDTVENLVLDLIEWVGRKERTYLETMDAWRTSCPRLPVWEDATASGLIETVLTSERRLVQLHDHTFLKKSIEAYCDLWGVH